MAVCTTCYNSGNIAQCPTNLLLSTVVTDTTFNAWIEHLSTGRVTGTSCESDEDGQVNVETFKLDPKNCYRIWLTAENEPPNAERIDITIDENVYTCIEFCTGDYSGANIPDESNLTP